MDKINFFPDNLEIKNQKIILRLDLNVPIKNKIIMDDTRIILCLPFIKKLIEKKTNISKTKIEKNRQPNSTLATVRVLTITLQIDESLSRVK